MVGYGRMPSYTGASVPVYLVFVNGETLIYLVLTVDIRSIFNFRYYVGNTWYYYT